MSQKRWPLIGTLLVALLPLGACGQDAADAAADPPAQVEEAVGSELSRITLTADAARRLGIETSVVEEGAGGDGLVVPYAAVLYDAEGITWAYVNPEELVFVREQLVVERIDGDVAMLSDGPAPGTAVVTVGAAELYGTETGVGGGH